MVSCLEWLEHSLSLLVFTLLVARVNRVFASSLVEETLIGSWLTLYERVSAFAALQLIDFLHHLRAADVELVENGRLATDTNLVKFDLLVGV